MYLVVFYVGEYVWVWVWVWVGVYTKSKSSELSPLRRKLLRFAKQFPRPLRSNNDKIIIYDKLIRKSIIEIILGHRSAILLFLNWSPRHKNV
jgi:hypothetical protein